METTEAATTSTTCRDHAPQRFLSVSEAARVIGCSEATVRRYSDSGTLRTERRTGDGSRWLDPRDVRAFADRRNAGAQS